ADAPQLTAYLLWQAVTALDQDGVAFTLGPAADGGFWLVGGNRPVPQSVWTGVRYSERRTGLELHRQLLRWGAIANLPPLTDVDTAADLPL
ncbi:DUF2064 domain-containing protein, partial [Salmonella enterica]|uniref:DUF2064 domain-containing protein n=1 Tax=Salmonella enterica TaxID=28901 RepID=UPI0032B391BA